jgi:hypothetical protein
MPTTVITGRDLVLTIATVNYDAQATTVSLEADHVIETYQTLDGRAYKAIDDAVMPASLRCPKIFQVSRLHGLKVSDPFCTA